MVDNIIHLLKATLNITLSISLNTNSRLMDTISNNPNGTISRCLILITTRRFLLNTLGSNISVSSNRLTKSNSNTAINQIMAGDTISLKFINSNSSHLVNSSKCPNKCTSEGTRIRLTVKHIESPPASSLETFLIKQKTRSWRKLLSW